MTKKIIPVLVLYFSYFILAHVSKIYIKGKDELYKKPSGSPVLMPQSTATVKNSILQYGVLK